MSEINEAVFKAWSESASFWDKHREARRIMFGPLTQALRESAGIREAPCHVLEVAAGPGDASLDIAASLGPQATVWCTDLVPGMVRIARRSSLERGLHNVCFSECSAENLPFGTSRFDAVLCRFGIMFFSDPLAGIREALRVLKPGGRVAYGVWGTRQANAFHRVIQDVLDRYVPGPPPDPDAPGAYRFAPRGKLLALMNQAGARNASERAFQTPIEAPLTFDRYFEIRTEMSDSLRDKLSRMTTDERMRLKEDVRKASLPYFSEAGFRFPAEILLVSGSRGE